MASRVVTSGKGQLPITALPREMRMGRAAAAETRLRSSGGLEGSGFTCGESVMCRARVGMAGARFCGMVSVDWQGARPSIAALADFHLPLASVTTPWMGLRISALR